MSDVYLPQRWLIKLSGGFIIAFHDLSASAAEKFIECLRPAKPIPLSDLVARVKAGKSNSGLFAITIDDGVNDTVQSLAQLFISRRWPATFYLPTRYISSDERMPFQWWRKLRPFLPHRMLTLKNGTMDLSQPGAIEEWSKRMEEQWHSQRLECYVPLISELTDLVSRETGIPIESLRPSPLIRWPDVAELSKNDLIRFESHGCSHSAMSALTDQELIEELKISRDLIAQHTGRECRHLAYPFGNPRSIGERVPKFVERFYDSAVTMSLGSVDTANPWLLPRIPLYPENSPLLARLKILLKCTIGSSTNRKSPPIVKPANTPVNSLP